MNSDCPDPTKYMQVLICPGFYTSLVWMFSDIPRSSSHH